MSTKTLADALAGIESQFGTQVCLDYCDNLYRSTYRDAVTFTVQDEPELSTSLIEVLAEYLARHHPDFKHVHCVDGEYDEYQSSQNYDLIKQYSSTAKDLLSTQQFCYLCNYKGESAGYAVLEDCTTMQVYISKYNYQ